MKAKKSHAIRVPEHRLNEQQLDMLRLSKTPMPEEAYKEIHRFIVQSLAKSLDEEMARLEKEKPDTGDLRTMGKGTHANSV